MADFPLRLPTESTIGRSGQEAKTRLVNGYVETLGVDKDGKSEFVIYARPGLARFAVNSFTGVARTLCLLNPTTLIAVLGAQVASFAPDGTSSVLLNLTGSDRITSALNENSTVPQIALVGDGGTYWLLSAGAVTTPSTSFPAANSVSFLKGKYLFTTAGQNGGLIFHSALNDGSTFNSLSFGYANSDPGNLIRGVADAGFYYVFGEKILEIWQDVGSFPFALAPVRQDIPMGLLAKYSVTKGAVNGLIWVDHRGIVRYGRDGGAQRISTHTVERAIETLSDTDRPNLIGTYFAAQGHEFYTLSSTQWTWVYDISMSRWYEWNAYGLPRWLVNDAVLFNGHWVACDYRNGLLYQTNNEEFDDAGNEFVLELWCPHLSNFRNSIIADSLDIDVASGVGLVSSSLSDDIVPMMQIDYSDNGGKLFKGERDASIGAAGDYGRLVRSNGWGRINQKGRIWRLRASSRVLRSVIQAKLRGRECL